MKLVIDISEDDYRKVQDGRASVSMMRKTIRNGNPLPKGHGRILDEKDILDTENNDGGWYDLVDMPEYIAGIKPIIESDKVESEDVE